MKRPHEIDVVVETAFIAEHSQINESRYSFAYTITICNRGLVSAQLLNRHWIITDANGRVQEVRGDGVVGEQPTLAPGEAFRYTSGCVLDSPVGVMHGHYGFRDEHGQEFNAPIAPFRLAVPGLVN
jgi:ApaG protein